MFSFSMNRHRQNVSEQKQIENNLWETNGTLKTNIYIYIYIKI